MRCDEVWWVNFYPSVGGEIRKKHPAVIISNDAANNWVLTFASICDIMIA